MTEDIGEPESRPGRHRSRRKRKRRTVKKVMHELRWLLGGVAFGLPVLALLTYIASKFGPFGRRCGRD